MSGVNVEVAVEMPLVVAEMSTVAEISLLPWTHVTAVAAVFDRRRRLTPWWVFRALARITAFFRPLRLHVSARL